VVDRASFDLALARAAESAGVEWVRERVRDVALEGGPGNADGTVAVATPSREYRVGAVVGADGANSLVRRRLHRPFARADLSIAAGYYAHGRRPAHIDIGFVDDPAGYLWSFPRADHAAVGICAQADESTPAALLATLDAWMRAEGLTGGSRLERYGWPIPSLGERTLASDAPAGPRWMLVGDAAGLVDPITREGIYFAIESAELAAAAFDTRDPGRAYVAALRREILPELARAARIKRRFFKSGFTGLLVDALASSGAIRRVMADLVAGHQPYATLKRRLVATCHVSLAWRLWQMERRGRRASPAGVHRPT
jgi:flavin-dependent dehydrogenase